MGEGSTARPSAVCETLNLLIEAHAMEVSAVYIWHKMSWACEDVVDGGPAQVGLHLGL